MRRNFSSEGTHISHGFQVTSSNFFLLLKVFPSLASHPRALTTVQATMHVNVHYHTGFRLSFPRRYKTFMIDEILSDANPVKTFRNSDENFRENPMRSTWPDVTSLTWCPGSTSYSLISSIALPSSPTGCQAPHNDRKTPAGGCGDSRAEQAAPECRKLRRSRTIFSQPQLVGLERKFQKQKYLSTPDRMDVAQSLGLTQLQVKTWYQNRRMKWKKMVLKTGQVAPTKPKGRPRKNSIPTMQEIEAAEQLAGLAEAQNLNVTEVAEVSASCGLTVSGTQATELHVDPRSAMQQTEKGVAG